MNQLINKKKKLTTQINVYLIIFLPISLLIGTLISNSVIILINILFLYELKIKKDNLLKKSSNFYFLIFIYIYLILNSIFIANDTNSIIRSVGFIRFIILAYAVNYYFKEFSEKILKFWLIIFLVVSLDIFFEYIFGSNILGFTSDEPTRIASFTRDELKIGGFYFGFIFICLLYLKNKKDLYFYICSIIFFYLSLIIGERSNFLKILFMYMFFVLFFIDTSVLKKFLIFLFISIFSIIIISKNEILKSRFYNQIFFPYIEAKQDIKFDLNSIIKNNEYFTLYYSAIKIFNENKLFGSGMKTYRIESMELKKSSNINLYGASNHPHQFHFEVLSELGLIGYFLLLSNLFYVIFLNTKKDQNYLRKSSILFLLATLIPLLPSGSFFTSFTASIFWINYAFLIKTDI